MASLALPVAIYKRQTEREKAVAAIAEVNDIGEEFVTAMGLFIVRH